VTSPLDPVRGALRDFVAGGPFEPLRAAIEGAASGVDADARLAERERDWFDELYDFVYAAAEDAEAADDELRTQLRELGLDRPPAGA
jgi:hypothetical protein